MIVKLLKFENMEYSKPLFLSKLLFLGQKQGFPNIGKFVLFQIFQNFRKNDVKIKILFSKKTLSDSNSDSNI